MGTPPDGTEERPRPLGFGECPHCPYLKSGTPEICFGCASTVVDQIQGRRCAQCDGALRDDGTCGNPMCGWTVDRRGWRYIHALAKRSGVLERVLNRYKYQDGKGWGLIFARLLVGYLMENFDPGTDHGVIVCNPSYVGPGGRTWDPTAFVLDRARIEDDRWPFVSNAIVKTGPTPKMVELSRRERLEVAMNELPKLLQVSDPSIVAGKNVLVYDDVFTTGATLRAVALKLKEAGAHDVDVVVLARQVFRGPSDAP